MESDGGNCLFSTNLQEVIDGVFKEDPELLSIFTRALTTYEGSDAEKLDPSCMIASMRSSHSFKTSLWGIMVK